MSNYNFRLSFFDGVTKPIGAAKSSVNAFAKSATISEKSIEGLESSIKDLTRVMAVMGAQMNNDAVGKASKKVSNLNKNVLTLTGSTLGLNRGMAKMAGSVGAAFVVGSALKSALSGLVEMEGAQARFSMLLGKNEGAASDAFEKVQAFAVKTPFSLADSTAAFESLLRQGLNPTLQELSSMGDIAAFSGKSMEDFSSILERAQKLDFTALEELGVKAVENGDKVKLTFQGQTQTVKATSEAMRNYVMGMANSSTVAGAMALQSQTTGGKIDALKDKFSIMTMHLGEALKPAISWVIDGLGWVVDGISDLTGWIQENSVWLGEWASVIGNVTFALGAAFVAFKLFLGVGSMLNGVIGMFGALTKGINLAKIAQIAFNFAASISPFGWVALVVSAVVGLVAAFGDLDAFLGGAFSITMGIISDIFTGLVFVITKVGEALSWMSGLFATALPTTAEGFKSMLGEDAFNEKMKSDSAFRSQIEKMQALESDKNKPSIKVTPAVVSDTFKVPTIKTGRGLLGSSSKEREVAARQSRFLSNSTINETGGKDKNGKSVSQGLAGVQGDMGAVKNITINIGKLVEGGINITTTNITEAAGKIQEMVSKALLTAVNDVNTM